MRAYIIFVLLLAIKVVSRIFWKVRLEWIEETEDPWSDLRVLALLNHTSLFEPVLIAAASNRLVWQIAAHGVVPVADKTLKRPLVGLFFRLIGRHVVSVTRERDETWAAVLERIEDPKALIVILPEGRMKRRTGLDLQGNPMTIRGGIADILASVPEGRLFIAYSEGLHHIHAPEDRFPRLFQRVWLGAEVLDIPTYRQDLLDRHGADSFKGSVIEDLTRRRDLYCDRVQREASGGSSMAPEDSAPSDVVPVSIAVDTPRPAADHD